MRGTNVRNASYQRCFSLLLLLSCSSSLFKRRAGKQQQKAEAPLVTSVSDVGWGMVLTRDVQQLAQHGVHPEGHQPVRVLLMSR
eukprot:6459222-Pyramimonas_sp.AAC.2